MSKDQASPSSYAWQDPGALRMSSKLSDVLSEEQEAQLAQLLHQVMEFGWGKLEIEIRAGQVRFFRPMPSIPAAGPGEDEDQV